MTKMNEQIINKLTKVINEYKDAVHKNGTEEERYQKMVEIMTLTDLLEEGDC